MPEAQRKGPKRVQAHVTGDTAVNVFKYRCPPEWVPNEARRDYGWDITVSLRGGAVVQEDFLVQLKGSQEPKYVLKNSYVVHRLRTSTVSWLIEKTRPTMLCICDTGRVGTPLNWVWLNDAFKEFDKKKPAWRAQKTITVRVPTTQVLDKTRTDVIEKIEKYVREFYANLNIERELGQVIGPAFGIYEPQVRSSYLRERQRFVQENVIPPLVDAGIVEPSGQVFSLDDQKRFRRVKEASSALRSFRDREAQGILSELSRDIDRSCDAIKALYFNSSGVLALHKDELDSAIRLFDAAHNIQPNERKYWTNLLYATYEQAVRASPDLAELPANWSDDLEAILSENPDFGPALRLKAYWISHKEGPEAAEVWLKSTALWSEERVGSLVVLAEAHLQKGQLHRAVEILSQQERQGAELDGIYWAVYALALMRTALGLKKMPSGRSRIHGPGPRGLDMTSLYRASECYREAVRWFESKGMPRFAEATVVNYSVCLGLLGRYSDSERICQSYLRQHPKSLEIQECLGESLFHQGRYAEAIAHEENVYTARPTEKSTFGNLFLCCFFAEEYEKVIHLLFQRQEHGFIDRAEEGLARSLGAIALFELGKITESRKQLERLESHPDLIAEASITKASLATRAGESKDKAVGAMRIALKEDPGNLKILSHLALSLAPATKENAAEIEACLTRVRKHRQLMVEEFLLLAAAHMILEKPEEADEVFYAACVRYPSEVRFLAERANTLMELGDQEGAFQVLQVYLKQGARDYSVLRNLGILALDTGRLDQAIDLFQMALGKTRDKREIADIHCQLYELKKHRRDPAKDILRHVVEYGRTREAKPESEARYLAMFFMAPIIADNQIDAEVKRWIADFQNRLNEFSRNHPDHPSLRSIQIKAHLPEKEKREEFLAQLSEIMLPHHLATTPLQLAIRHKTYPLVFRAEFLRGYGSVFRYWEECTRSTEFGHAIHIFGNINNLKRELQVAQKADTICVDLTALLTLAELDFLVLLSSSFNRLLIARGTKMALDQDLLGAFSPHRLANKIEEWRLASRHRIRVRTLGLTSPGSVSSNIPLELSLVPQLSCGVGETVGLARKLHTALYSDESVVRQWAETDYGVPTFGTLAFMKLLMANGLLTLEKETASIAKLIKLNFRTIPLQVAYLNVPLKELVRVGKRSGRLPHSDDLQADDILGVLLRQFGDTTVNPVALGNLAVEWWKSVLFDQAIPTAVLPECMQYPVFALSQRTSGGVLTGISAAEPPMRAAILWTAFLWRCFRERERSAKEAWNALKVSCSRLFCDETHQAQVLFQFLPRYLASIIEKDSTLSTDQKLSCLVKLPLSFEEHERLKFEDYFRRHKPKFMS